MKTEDLIVKALRVVMGVVSLIALALTAIVCSQIWLAEKIYNAYKAHKMQVVETLQVSILFVVFLFLLVFLSITFQLR